MAKWNEHITEKPIPVSERSKAWVCVHCVAWIGVSNHIDGRDVCLL